jgi:glutamyl-tRNA synthetase
MHIGNFRGALYNYLFAKKNGGIFYLRIEDTDRTRLVEGGVEAILRTLERMGLSYDKGPFIQSERLEIYKGKAEELIAASKAYPCFCSSERLDTLRKSQEAQKLPTGYDRLCRSLDKDAVADKRKDLPHVIRFAMPGEGETEFHDLVRGPVKFQNKLIDDYVLLKSDGFPTYHLASVVDDHLMETSHVIRGEEWLSSTPKHILLYRAFGWKPPIFAHLPLLLNADRSKLSKRQGDVAVEDYLDQGYLPEAITNFVALLGWNPSAEKEVYSMAELIEAFDVSQVNSSGAVFNREKLDWLNGKYLRALTPAEFARRARPFLMSNINCQASSVLDDDELGKLLALEQERVKTLAELPEAVDFLFQDTLDFPVASLSWKGRPLAEVSVRLEAIKLLFGALDESEFDRKTLEEKVKGLIAENGWGNGDTLWPLRVALSGREKSPGPFEIAEVLGKMKVLERLHAALRRLP